MLNLTFYAGYIVFQMQGVQENMKNVRKSSHLDDERKSNACN